MDNVIAFRQKPKSEIYDTFCVSYPEQIVLIFPDIVSLTDKFEIAAAPLLKTDVRTILDYTEFEKELLIRDVAKTMVDQLPFQFTETLPVKSAATQRLRASFSNAEMNKNIYAPRLLQDYFHHDVMGAIGNAARVAAQHNSFIIQA